MAIVPSEAPAVELDESDLTDGCGGLLLGDRPTGVGPAELACCRSRWRPTRTITTSRSPSWRALLTWRAIEVSEHARLQARRPASETLLPILTTIRRASVAAVRTLDWIPLKMRPPPPLHPHPQRLDPEFGPSR